MNKENIKVILNTFFDMLEKDCLVKFVTINYLDENDNNCKLTLDFNY